MAPILLPFTLSRVFVPTSEKDEKDVVTEIIEFSSWSVHCASLKQKYVASQGDV